MLFWLLRLFRIWDAADRKADLQARQKAEAAGYREAARYQTGSSQLGDLLRTMEKEDAQKREQGKLGKQKRR